MRFPAILKLWAAHTTPVCATLTAVHPYHSSHPQRSGPVTNNASSSPGRQHQGDMTKRKAVDGENGDAAGTTQRRSTRLKTTAAAESTEPIVAEKSRRPAQTLKAKAGPIKAPKSPKTEVDGTRSKVCGRVYPGFIHLFQPICNFWLVLLLFTRSIQDMATPCLYWFSSSGACMSSLQ